MITVLHTCDYKCFVYTADSHQDVCDDNSVAVGVHMSVTMSSG